MDLINEYKKHIKKREKENIPPVPLNKKEVECLIQYLSSENVESEFLLDLFKNNINPGVDESAYEKAKFLKRIIFNEVECFAINKKEAIKILGSMKGGYNVPILINILKLNDSKLSKIAMNELKHTILIYDSFNEIVKLYESNNIWAKELMESWSNAQWFTSKEPLKEEIKLTVYKVAGETNTDDLSPATQAFTRSDIPLHANSMLISRMKKPLEVIKELKKEGNPIVYVGDVVGTGSSRKSGINSIQWHIGDFINGIPNKKTGGIIIGSTIAPIFFNTAQDSGCLPIIADVDKLNTGDKIILKPYEGKIFRNNELVSEFELNPDTILDEIRAGGRIPLIIGRELTEKAIKFLKKNKSQIFTNPKHIENNENIGYTQAQKIVGKACGLKGVKPFQYVLPKVTTVGSQDTTGAMTRDEIKELAALGFGAELVMQSFCHTAPYPKMADIKLRHTLPKFMTSRGGVSLKPGDGVIHSWLNRLCLPDTLGTGGDSHTRFPIGLSFPAGSGLVAFAAVTGTMPLTMPESVLIKFKGEMQKGITLRDLVNAIPYQAIKNGLLTVPKKNKKNIFAGCIIEIEGLSDLKVEQAFELSDSAAERSAAACCVKLNKEPIAQYLKSNIALIQKMIENGYEDIKTLQKRIEEMKKWLEDQVLLEADNNANYKEIIEIDINKIKEPILACPNDPDDVATLSEILNDNNRIKEIDEVFIGSCMTNIGLFRAAGEILRNNGETKGKLWIAPPTKMDKMQLVLEGYYSVFAQAGARMEIPGCSLCMGNQAHVSEGSVVVSTSTRNFDNRLGKNSKVYLGSAEFASICAILGRIPEVEEYLDIFSEKITNNKNDIYKNLEFDKLSNKNLSELFIN